MTIEAISSSSIYQSMQKDNTLQNQMDLVISRSFTTNEDLCDNLAELFSALENKASKNDPDSISMLLQISCKPDFEGKPDLAAKAASNMLKDLFNKSEVGSHSNSLISDVAKILYGSNKNKMELPSIVLEAAVQGYLNQDNTEKASEVMDVLRDQARKAEPKLGIMTETQMLANIQQSKNEFFEAQAKVLSSSTENASHNDRRSRIENIEHITTSQPLDITEDEDIASIPRPLNSVQINTTSSEDLNRALVYIPSKEAQISYDAEKIDYSNFATRLLKENNQSESWLLKMMGQWEKKHSVEEFEPTKSTVTSAPKAIEFSQPTHLQTQLAQKASIPLSLAPREIPITPITATVQKKETSSNEVYELMVGEKSPLVTPEISPSTTDNQLKVTWYNPFSVMAASLNWAVGREFQDGRTV